MNPPVVAPRGGKAAGALRERPAVAWCRRGVVRRSPEAGPGDGALGRAASGFDTGSGGNLVVSHADGLGSERALSGSSGSVSQTYGTDDDGIPTRWQVLGSLDQPLRYAGEPTDSTGFSYLRARSDDPQIGRFLSADPVRKSGAGVTGWNRYAYGGDNPVNRTDPSGLCDDPGGPGIRYCLDRYIPTAQACLLGLCFAGDDRGPSASSGDMSFRVRQTIYQTPEGVTTSRAQLGLSVAADDVTRAVLGESAPGQVTACYVALASSAAGRALLASCGGVDGLLERAGYLWPGIQSNVALTESANGKARVLWARGTPYPSLEVYQYWDGPHGVMYRRLYDFDATAEGTSAWNLWQQDEVLTDRQPAR